MTTHYPPGMDGAAIEQRTAAQLQHVLRDWLACDATATASGTPHDDMITVRIAGMHARSLMRQVAERFAFIDLGDGPIRR